MGGFRSLGDEEEVEFECKPSDKGFEAIVVTGVEGDECKGSHRRPMSKKKFKKVRCYNCGDFANHIAAKCNMGPQPKKCHHCKAVDHLIADCPQREEQKKLFPASGKGLMPTVNGDIVVVVDLGGKVMGVTRGGDVHSVGSEEECILKDSGGDTGSSSSERHLSDSGITRCTGKTPTTEPTTDDAKSETSAPSVTSDGSRGRD